MQRYFLFILIIFSLFSCWTEQKKGQAETKASFTADYNSNSKAIVSVRTFDHYTRRIDDGYGVYIAPDLVLTSLSLIKGAYKARVAPHDIEDFGSVQGFVSYDLNSDLVLLKVTKRSKNFVAISEAEQNPDSVYSLFRKERQLFTRPSKIDSLAINDTLSLGFLSEDLQNGTPLFGNNHRFAGLYNNENETITLANAIQRLLNKKAADATSIYELRNKTNKVYISHTLVKGFRIITNKGTIEIELFDDTPTYRDNFIKLVSDHYYDSLLIHRVIKDFLIQTGALDTKYAKKDDVVGWQGPGYTLPMKILPHLFHQRGHIAASKLPEDRNKNNRSDGSQFYIISGRVFSETELDELEKEKGITYSKDQRRIYTTIGGAPYLDGDYTVFGRVVQGMDVVDRLAAVATYAIDRPVDEIRIKTIEILKK